MVMLFRPGDRGGVARVCIELFIAREKSLFKICVVYICVEYKVVKIVLAGLIASPSSRTK